MSISTHAPAGGATRIAEIYYSGREFLLTPLREGRQTVPAPAFGRQHFYSRPCGRGDKLVEERFIGHCISTHAPAGGATSVFQFNRRKIGISTHAPAGGATRKPRCNRPGALYFYSRPCGRGDSGVNKYIYSHTEFLLTPLREGRLGELANAYKYLRISTHAPAGGATLIFRTTVL